MSIQHKSLEDEILFLLGRSITPLDAGQIYERVELADEIKQVSNALYRMKASEKIERVESEGRARYSLAKGVAAPAAPATAGKAGRPLETAEPAQPAAAAEQLTGGMPPPGPGLPVLDIPTLGAPAMARKKPGPKPKAAPAAAALQAATLPPEEHAAETPPELDAARLADAIIARLKQSFAPIQTELGAGSAPSLSIHIEQVDIHLGGL